MKVEELGAAATSKLQELWVDFPTWFQDELKFGIKLRDSIDTENKIKLANFERIHQVVQGHQPLAVSPTNALAAASHMQKKLDDFKSKYENEEQQFAQCCKLRDCDADRKLKWDLEQAAKISKAGSDAVREHGERHLCISRELPDTAINKLFDEVCLLEGARVKTQIPTTVVWDLNALEDKNCTEEVHALRSIAMLSSALKQVRLSSGINC